MKRGLPLPKPRKRIARRTRPCAKGGQRFKLSGEPDEPFRAWVQRRGCWFRYGVATPMPCAGVIHPHHVKARGAGGQDAGNLLPLCAAHHGWLHTVGRKAVESYMVDVDLSTAANSVWQVYQRAGVPPEGW